MKNEDIHKSFYQSEVRDFLAQELRNAQRKWGGPSDILETKIKELQERLRYSKKVEAVEALLEEHNWENWENWDVSDDVSYHSETYFSFVGTKEEFRELEKQLEEEEQ